MVISIRLHMGILHLVVKGQDKKTVVAWNKELTVEIPNQAENLIAEVVI